MKQESMKRYCPGFQNPATLVVERFNMSIEVLCKTEPAAWRKQKSLVAYLAEGE
ncbi:MAG: hypothetical protein ACOY9Y_08895 [Bacillota bacterium]